ncbi:WD repeat, SAM and U-box domain-containing protein 1-like [Symsagittifera roscoffensis]|uniref:WD repeat, SAM and U-box domain-containing protein 1-like n=1 Tax=Symsagittifera roscoffensis TaxID=84072 RepID=UPI00307BF454
MVIEAYNVKSEIKFDQQSDVNSVSFNATGALLAVCTCDRKIHLLGANASGSSFEHLPVSPLNAKSEHHSYAVSCCTFSPLSPLLATCGIDGCLIVWDLLDVSQPTIYSKYQAGQFKCCRFSPHPDVPLVAAGDAEGVVHLYDLVRRTVRHKLKGPQGQITGLAFSPDGLWLLAGASGMGTGDLWLWSTTKLPSQLQEVSSAHAHAVDTCAHEMGVYCIQFSPSFSSGDSAHPSGLLLATGGGDNLAKLWTVLPHVRENSRVQLRAKLEYHTYMVSDVDFSSDGQLLCTVSVDKRVLIWDPHSAELLQVLDGHLRFIYTCSWNPFPDRSAGGNARVLATGGNDKNVLIWNIFVRGEGDLMRFTNSHNTLPDDQMTLTSAAAISNGDGSGGGGGVSESEGGVLPDEFFCPISHEVMGDPVVASDGYSYERVALQKWFLTSHTSPITNLPLPSLQLIPNRTLRSLIKTQLEKTQLPVDKDNETNQKEIKSTTH